MTWEVLRCVSLIIFFLTFNHSLSSVSSLSTMSSTTTPKKQVLIAGSGVIGTSTAYFLAKEFGISQH